jgi:phospholipase C
VSYRLSRRHFIRTTAGATGAVALSGAELLQAQRPTLPRPQQSGIDRIVVVMMENRSFDHMLGWLPGADGRQAGLEYADDTGAIFPTYRLATGSEGDFTGCGHPDPDHSYDGGRIQFNDGACDGWLRAGDSDEYAIGYYTDAELPFFSGAARDWTVCDRWFSSILGPTFPNRFYLHSGQTDRITNSFGPFDLSDLPTIWDRLSERKVSARYYFSDAPFLGLWGLKYRSISRHISSFFEACRTGKLPEVSFVEPRFLESSTGLSSDDHPHADVRDGQVFQNAIYAAVTNSPSWHSTMLVFIYDEWGGFFDHVAPPIAPTSPIDQAAGNLDGRLGFRVPAIIVAPFAQRNTVASTTFDHTSVLRFIEWRWKLDPLTERSATANNLADVLDFSTRNLTAPSYLFPPGPYGGFCPPVAPDKWETLLEMLKTMRFFD